MMVVEVLFWTAAAVVLYAYVGFPLLLLLRGLLVRRPWHGRDVATPSASMIVVAYNEAEGIEDKLDNTLALDYPRELLEVIVASDGSTDQTEALVGRYADRGVRLLALPRQGKDAALNTAVARAAGDVLVFSDANSLYAPRALRELVAPLGDPQVGGVAGNQVYRDPSRSSPAGTGERLYWELDRKLKQWGSRSDHALSATGAIYALRRHLFQPVPPGVSDDFVISARVVAQGYRLVFAPDAVAYEWAPQSSRVEFRRKVRVITRGLHGVLLVPQLLNPLRFGFYSVQLFSQKILRRLVVLPLLTLLFAASLLAGQGGFYGAAGAAQWAFYGLAGVGLLTSRWRLGGCKLFAVPFYFCLVNAACLVAWLHVLRGRRMVTWEPRAGDRSRGWLGWLKRDRSVDLASSRGDAG